MVALGLGIADGDFVDDAAVGCYVGLLGGNPDFHLAIASVGTIKIWDEGDVARVEYAQAWQEVGMCGFHGDGGSLGNEGLAQRASVVGELGAVNERSPLHGQTAGVGGDGFVGAHLVGNHGKGDFHDVACLPGARQQGIAVLHTQFRRLPVDGQLHGLGLAVEVGVEVGVHGSVLCPSGDAQFQCEFGSFGGIDPQAHASLPGVVGLLGEADGVAAEGDVGGVAYEEVDEEVVVEACGIDVSGHGGDEAAEVGGTA